MIPPGTAGRRARRRLLFVVRAVAALASLAFGAGPVLAQGQDTLRQDTLRADSLAAAQDTVPPPVLVALPRADSIPGGLTDGRWVWDQRALLDEGEITLLDLLSRLPGIATLESGVLLQPATASAFGGGADRLIVVWDGFEVDPLVTASLDLATVELAHIERVEVERRADALVIHLYSVAPRDAQPYSRIEAGVGEPRANLFRGMLLTPHFVFGPFGFAVERTEVQGSGRLQPADVFAGWVRWGLLGEHRGIEFTLRNNGMHRETGSPVPADLSRRDMVVRGRTTVGSNAVAEAYFGRSTGTLDGPEPETPDEERLQLDEVSRQAGARLAWQRDRYGGGADLRWRDNDRLPKLDADLHGNISPVDRLSLRGGLSHQKWESGFGATSWHAAANLQVLSRVQVFGEMANGIRGSPSRVDSITTPHKSDRTVMRGGIEARLGRLTAAAAGIRTSADSIPLPGLPADTLVGAVAGGTVMGWEAALNMPLAGSWLSFDGSWSAWVSGVRPVYTPASMGRATLRLHTVPLESGNFELLARVDAARRGPVSGPPVEVDGGATEAAGRTLFNAYLQIRIIDIRIWARFDDIGSNDVEDAPGLPIRGPRIYYGVKWNFWN